MSSGQTTTLPPSSDTQAVQEEIDIDLGDPQVGEAAKKIQSAFRFKREKKPDTQGQVEAKSTQ